MIIFIHTYLFWHFVIIMLRTIQIELTRLCVLTLKQLILSFQLKASETFYFLWSGVAASTLNFKINDRRFKLMKDALLLMCCYYICCYHLLFFQLSLNLIRT